MDFSVLALSSGLLVAILCFLLFSPKHKKLPPGPFNLPLVGALPLLGPLPHISLLKLSKTYGDIMYMKIGTMPLVVISSGRLAKEFYRHHGAELASSRPELIAVQHFFNALGMSNYTTEVKYYRKIVTTHLLSARMLKINEKVRHQEHLNLVSSVLSEQGRPFKLIQKLHEMNMNIAGRMLLGKRFYGGESMPELDVFKETLLESMRIAGLLNISDIIPALRWLDLQGLEKQCKQLASKINQHLVSILEERKSSNASKTSDGPLPFIDTLTSLDSTDEHVPDDKKLAILTELLLATIDTSAVSAEWAMTELFKHPKALERASKEIQDVVGNDRLVEESDLPKLPVVEAIAKETLRLHPPGPLSLPKIALGGPTQLAGYAIPSNIWVYVNFYAVGTDGDYWEDPLEFRPERFLDQDKHIDVFGQDFNLLPFGSGRRVCPGAKLGFDTLQTAIAMLVHGFEWEFDLDEMDMGLTNGLVCHKTQPLVAAAKPKLQCLL